MAILLPETTSFGRHHTLAAPRGIGFRDGHDPIDGLMRSRGIIRDDTGNGAAQRVRLVPVDIVDPWKAVRHFLTRRPNKRARSPAAKSELPAVKGPCRTPLKPNQANRRGGRTGNF